MTTEGILGTEVTWEIFEESLGAALGNSARLGPAKTVVNIGEDIGFASFCGLINCDWQGVCEGEKLPETVVLKIPTFAPLRVMNAALSPEQQKFADAKWAAMEPILISLHNTEVATYEFLAPFKELQIPRVFYAVPMGGQAHGQLCLSYVPNSRTMNHYEIHTVEQVRQIARALGKIRGCSLNAEPTAPEINKDYFDTCVNAFPLETLRNLAKSVLAFDDSTKTHELMDKINILLPKYYNTNIGLAIRKKLDIRPMIFHADLHTENVLIDKQSGDLASIIDWQATHMGAGVEDLHRIMMSALSTKERRAATPMLLEEMHTTLVRSLNGAEPPYSLDTLLRLSDLLFPPYAIFSACITTSKLSKLKNDPKQSEEEKKKRIDAVLDKIIGTFEDVVALDEQNKTHLEKIQID